MANLIYVSYLISGEGGQNVLESCYGEYMACSIITNFKITPCSKPGFLLGLNSSIAANHIEVY